MKVEKLSDCIHEKILIKEIYNLTNVIIIINTETFLGLYKFLNIFLINTLNTDIFESVC